MRSDQTRQHICVADYAPPGAFCKWALTLGSLGGTLQERAGRTHRREEKTANPSTFRETEGFNKTLGR